MELSQAPLRVAVAGHPGTGKSTLASHLSKHTSFDIIDLPGVHLLAPNTPHEKDVYDLLVGRSGEPVPDAVVVLVDVQKFTDQLYLAGQMIDLRIPVVVGVTGIEAGRRQGKGVRLDWLSTQLGVPVVETSPAGEHAEAMGRILEEAMHKLPARQQNHWRPSLALGNAYNHFDSKWSYYHLRPLHAGGRLLEGLRLLGTPKAAEEYESHPAYAALERTLAEARQMLTDRKENWSMAEVMQRHQWAQQIASHAVQEVEPGLKDRMLNWASRAPKWVGWAFIAGAVGLAVLLWAWVSG